MNSSIFAKKSIQATILQNIFRLRHNMHQFKMKKVTAGISLLLFFLVYVAADAERCFNNNNHERVRNDDDTNDYKRSAIRDGFSQRNFEQRVSRVVNIRGRVGSERLVNNRRIVDSDSRLSNYPVRDTNTALDVSRTRSDAAAAEPTRQVTGERFVVSNTERVRNLQNESRRNTERLRERAYSRSRLEVVRDTIASETRFREETKMRDNRIRPIKSNRETERFGNSQRLDAIRRRNTDNERISLAPSRIVRTDSDDLRQQHSIPNERNIRNDGRQILEQNSPNFERSRELTRSRNIRQVTNNRIPVSNIERERFEIREIRRTRSEPKEIRSERGDRASRDSITDQRNAERTHHEQIREVAPVPNTRGDRFEIRELQRISSERKYIRSERHGRAASRDSITNQRNLERTSLEPLRRIIREVADNRTPVADTRNERFDIRDITRKSSEPRDIRSERYDRNAPLDSTTDQKNLEHTRQEPIRRNMQEATNNRVSVTNTRDEISEIRNVRRTSSEATDIRNERYDRTHTTDSISDKRYRKREVPSNRVSNTRDVRSNIRRTSSDRRDIRSERRDQILRESFTNQRNLEFTSEKQERRNIRELGSVRTDNIKLWRSRQINNRERSDERASRTDRSTALTNNRENGERVRLEALDRRVVRVANGDRRDEKPVDRRIIGEQSERLGDQVPRESANGQRNIKQIRELGRIRTERDTIDSVIIRRDILVNNKDRSNERESRITRNTASTNNRENRERVRLEIRDRRDITAANDRASIATRRDERSETRDVRSIDNETRNLNTERRDEQRTTQDNRMFRNIQKQILDVQTSIDENNNKIYKSYLNQKYNNNFDTAWSKLLTTVTGILILGQIVHANLNSKRFCQIKSILTSSKEKVY